MKINVLLTIDRKKEYAPDIQNCVQPIVIEGRFNRPSGIINLALYSLETRGKINIIYFSNVQQKYCLFLIQDDNQYTYISYSVECSIKSILFLLFFCLCEYVNLTYSSLKLIKYMTTQNDLSIDQQKVKEIEGHM